MKYAPKAQFFTIDRNIGLLSFLEQTSIVVRFFQLTSYYYAKIILPALHILNFRKFLKILAGAQLFCFETTVSNETAPSRLATRNQDQRGAR